MDEKAYREYQTGAAATVGTVPDYYPKEFKKSRQWLAYLFIIGGPILLCAILLLVFFFAPSHTDEPNFSTHCMPSAESNRSKFTETLKKIETVFFETLHPNEIYTKFGATPEEIRRIFRPWDPSPSTLRSKTDAAAKLLEDLNALTINVTLLKVRERKALHVANALLLNNNGWTPLGSNYYAGDWMLGPDVFCMQPICFVLGNLNVVISYFKPHNLNGLRELDKLIQQYNHTFETYVENLKFGVRAGYIRSRQACIAGLHNLHYLLYRNIALQNETGREQLFNFQFSLSRSQLKYFGEVSVRDRSDQPHASELMILQVIYSIHNSWHAVRIVNVLNFSVFTDFSVFTANNITA